MRSFQRLVNQGRTRTMIGGADNGKDRYPNPKWREWRFRRVIPISLAESRKKVGPRNAVQQAPMHLVRENALNRRGFVALRWAMGLFVLGCFDTAEAQSSLTLSSSALSFTAQAGSNAPLAQSVTVTAGGNPAKFTVSSDSPWLAATTGTPNGEWSHPCNPDRTSQREQS